jgi:hypothetical protein
VTRSISSDHVTAYDIANTMRHSWSYPLARLSLLTLSADGCLSVYPGLIKFDYVIIAMLQLSLSWHGGCGSTAGLAFSKGPPPMLQGSYRGHKDDARLVRGGRAKGLTSLWSGGVGR